MINEFRPRDISLLMSLSQTCSAFLMMVAELSQKENKPATQRKVSCLEHFERLQDQAPLISLSRTPQPTCCLCVQSDLASIIGNQIGTTLQMEPPCVGVRMVSTEEENSWHLSKTAWWLKPPSNCCWILLILS